ncbi:hypothetical protein Ac2012v2_004148 [Leucoagaricus gongylophorus]
MLVFSDRNTGDEMFTDAYKYVEQHDVVWEVDCASIVIKEGDVDIGANPSAEEQEEGLEDGSKTVINLVHSSGLVQTNFAKKDYLTSLKGYIKGIREYLQTNEPERVASFEKGASAFAKIVSTNFKDYEFFIGKSMDPDGMVALLNYREDGITRKFSSASRLVH